MATPDEMFEVSTIYRAHGRPIVQLLTKGKGWDIHSTMDYTHALELSLMLHQAAMAAKCNIVSEPEVPCVVN